VGVECCCHCEWWSGWSIRQGFVMVPSQVVWAGGTRGGGDIGEMK